MTRTDRRSRLRSLSLSLAVLAAGCGSATTTFTCDPVCPTGLACTATGCAAVEAPVPDLSVRPDIALECGGTGPRGTTCNFANATSGSSNGCYLEACRFGWDDCDGAVDTGCETSVLTDVKNCGYCGNHCPSLAHAANSCVNANCQITTCSANYG